MSVRSSGQPPISGVGRIHAAASFESVLSALDPTRDLREDGWGGVRIPPFAFGDGQPAGASFRTVEQAFEDFAPAGRAVATEPTLPSDDIDAVASELALWKIPDQAGLQDLRRRFMWANHPDRRSDLPPGLANRRVALANMLIDRERARRAARK